MTTKIDDNDQKRVSGTRGFVPTADAYALTAVDEMASCACSLDLPRVFSG